MRFFLALISILFFSAGLYAGQNTAKISASYNWIVKNEYDLLDTKKSSAKIESGSISAPTRLDASAIDGNPKLSDLEKVTAACKDDADGLTDQEKIMLLAQWKKEAADKGDYQIFYNAHKFLESPGKNIQVDSATTLVNAILKNVNYFAKKMGFETKKEFKQIIAQYYADPSQPNLQKLSDYVYSNDPKYGKICDRISNGELSATISRTLLDEK